MKVRKSTRVAGFVSTPAPVITAAIELVRRIARRAPGRTAPPSRGRDTEDLLRREELVEDVGEVLRLPVHADREEDAHHPHRRRVDRLHEPRVQRVQPPQPRKLRRRLRAPLRRRRGSGSSASSTTTLSARRCSMGGSIQTETAELRRDGRRRSRSAASLRGSRDPPSRRQRPRGLQIQAAARTSCAKPSAALAGAPSPRWC